MTKIRHFLTFLMIGILSFSFSACGTTSDSAVPTGCLRLNGQDIETAWVMRVNGDDISADEYRYFYMNVAYEMLEAVQIEMDTTVDSADVEWTDEENETALSSALDYVLLNHALFILAEEYGLALTDTDLEDIQDTVIAAKSEYSSEDDFYEGLALNYITPEYYPILLRSTVIQQKLSTYLTGDDGLYAITEDEMKEKVLDEYVCVRFLYLEKSDEDSGEDNRSVIDSYASQATDKDTFIDFINRYSDDPSSKNNAAGVYIGPGIGNDTVYETALTLEAGQISGVIESDDGYYMVLRLNMDDAYIDANISQFVSEYQSNIVSKLLSDTVATMTVEYNPDIYPDISLSSME